MLKTYKYRLYPDDNQKDFLSRQFGCCRFVYNWGLELKTKSWQAYKKGISIYKIANKLPELKKENPWLAEVCSQPLQQSLFHLEKGFTSFFEKRRNIHGSSPSGTSRPPLFLNMSRSSFLQEQCFFQNLAGSGRSFRERFPGR